ncbi:hypothetical protein [uncultured Mameliella sp.]|mgnify:FL=1|uniref:hypothetical protein n=1 Tax=uncultured Mameliella sp. TaxID=1447087 RepID=UPI002609B8A5|nr:hypothetical protein [uncultured Mameliella sp.]
MVAYSFQKRFCDDVAEWRKRQTIRAKRKRHARPGEWLQLYFGMRTKHCRKLVNDPICTGVTPIMIWVPLDDVPCRYAVPDQSLPLKWRWQVVDDAFAHSDGFEDERDFRTFWKDAHGEGVFEGVLITWMPSPIRPRQ